MTTSDDAGLRKQILKNGTVRKGSVSFTQKIYSNSTSSPIEMNSQEIVEIGIDDLMQLIAQHTAVAVQAAREDTIWNIMSPKTEGLFDGGDLFIKRAPIEQAIINMVGFEKWKAMQEAVDAQLQADAGRSGEGTS